MEKKSKKSIIIGITSLFLVTLILLGLTYAYYRTRIIGNTADTSLSVVSKKLEIKYGDDNAVITASNIAPGYSVSKEFTVTNTGDGTVNFSIVLDNIENTFTRKEDWTYTLSDSNGNEITSGEVPSSKTWIKNSIAIDAKATNTYTLTLSYANLTSVDQSEDMGKNLSLRINIEDEMGSILEAAEEGTLLAAIGRDNLISETLTVPGQEVSLVTVYGEGDLIKMPYVMLIDYRPASYTRDIVESDRYFVYATDYKYDKETNTYTLTNVNYCLYSECYSDLVGKYLISNSAYSASATTLESAKALNTSGLKEIYLIEETTYDDEEYPDSDTGVSWITAKINYSIKTEKKSISGESVLASTEDDYGTSYYFRGNVDNNYVNYSGMCWRIVRIQGDGSIKLVLADENGECNASTYSVSNGASAFVNGDLEGGSLKTWITNKITDTSKLQETEWCHDTTYTDDTSSESEWEYFYKYGAANRLIPVDAAEPTLKCKSISLDNTNDVTVATYGILTADEVAFAGAVYGKESFNYLKDNAAWKYWTNSPQINLYNLEGTIRNFYVESNGMIDTLTNGVTGGTSENDDWCNLFVGSNYGSTCSDISDGPQNYAKIANRPAIVLKSDVMATGSGTQSDPYVIS